MNASFSSHATGRTYFRLVMAGSLAVGVLLLGSALAGPSDPGFIMLSRVMCAMALMSGLLALALGERESNIRYRLFMLLLAVWLTWTGVQEIVQNAFVQWLIVSPEKSYYAAEFNHMMWTLLGLLLGAFAFTDSVLAGRSVATKWFAALGGVLVLWAGLWLPVLQDPELLYKQPLVEDFVAVDGYLSEHWVSGKMPQAQDIAGELSLIDREGRGPGTMLQGEQNVARIEEVLGYLRGPEDYVMLVLRPLNERDGWAAVICVVCLGIALGVRFLRDRPESAFIEKILLLLFLIWVFESLHAFSFSLLRSLEAFRSVHGIGYGTSAMLFIVLAYLLSRRTDFVTSIEGQYYERVLLRDASLVTRWVDPFDRFILSRFLGRRGPLRRLFTLKND